MNLKNFLLLSLLLLLPSLVAAQNWQWTRDDLVLNPSGLDLNNAFDWAWGDLDHDGLTDVLIRTTENQIHWRVTAYRGRSSPEPPFWVEAPDLLEGFPHDLASFGLRLADFDGDGFPNLITHYYEVEKPHGPRGLLLFWKRDERGKWQADTTVFQEGELDYDRLFTESFFGDADEDGDLDILIGTGRVFGRIAIRFFENLGASHQPMWREDSSRLELVYNNPVGYESWSPVFMHANADSMIDLLVAYVVEGFSSVVAYPGIRDEAGRRWSGNYDHLISTYLPGGVRKLWPFESKQDHRCFLAILQAGTGRLCLKSVSPGPFFDANYFRVGSFRFYHSSSALVFDFGNDGQTDLLTLGLFGGFFGDHPDFQSYQKEPFGNMTLWRDTDWFGTPFDAGDCLIFKAQLTDLNQNGLPDFVASAYPFYFGASENASPTFQAEWQGRGNLITPFVRTGTRQDTLYFDPSFADLDGDSDVDLLIIQKHLTFPDTGLTRYLFFENRLASDTIIWAKRNDWLTGLEGVIHANSNFVDLDRDGDADLVFGTREGTLLAYENTGGSAFPAWRLLPGVFSGIDAGDDAAPTFGDFDHDGRVDLFLGNRNGELFFYRNETPLTVQSAAIQNVPARIHLFQNSPNPFNAGTRITYEIPRASRVQLSIHDLLGRRVTRLVDEAQSAGLHSASWNGQDGAGREVPSGVYLYVLKAAGFEHIKRMVVLR